MTSSLLNFIASTLRQCVIHPDRLAIIEPVWNKAQIIDDRTITYGEYHRQVSELVAGLARIGVRSGDRVVVFIPPSIQLYVVLGALFAANIAAVFIDVGFSPRRVAQCVQAAKASAIIGDPRLALLKALRPTLWRIPLFVTGYPIPFLSQSISRLFWPVSKLITGVACQPDDPCIITFTGGSTGTPKAAHRAHAVLIQQLDACTEFWPVDQFDSGSGTFPVSAFIAFSSGKTWCIPATHLRAQAQTNGHLIAAQFNTHAIQTLACSPAFITAVLAADRPLPSLRYILIGGAPLLWSTALALRQRFSTLAIDIAYGATEIDPVSIIDIDTYIKNAQLGVPIGRPLSRIDYRLIDPRQLPNPNNESVTCVDLDAIAVAPGQIGELVVWSTHLIPRYTDPIATLAQKVRHSGDGKTWHRMGDMAFEMTDGTLVLVGRLSDALPGGLYPFPIEQAFSNVFDFRVAVVNQSGVLLVVVERDNPIDGVQEQQLVAVLASFGVTAFSVATVGKIPTDIRHNSRIMRTELINQVRASNIKFISA